MDQLENSPQFAHRLFSSAALARIGRPDILWSVNKLARASLNGPERATNVWRV